MSITNNALELPVQYRDPRDAEPVGDGAGLYVIGGFEVPPDPVGPVCVNCNDRRRP